MKHLAVCLTVLVLAAPLVLFPAPKFVHAQSVYVTGGQLDTSWADLAKNTITSLETTLTAGSAFSLQVKEYVLDPIAWLLSQQMIQSIAGSVINFVNGQGNGSGSPQFVQDLLGFLQSVGDNQAFAFLAQFVGNSNSPFAYSISSSLRTNYLQETSLGGFFAGNSCTLSQVTSNIGSYLAGDWSQGGLASWFALTTQNQNNPYTLYQRTSNQLGSMVLGAQAAQQQQLNWGQGFLSWCNSTGTGGGAVNVAGLTSVACLNADGTAGMIETPGSVIHDQLAKVLGAGVDKLVSADEINEIIGQLAMGLVSNVLGGSSGGLYGVSQYSNNRPSYVSQYQVENPQGSSSGSGGSTGSISDMALQNVANYEAVSNAIISAANSAAAAENQLANSCSSYSTSAQSTITNQIDPVIAEQQALIATAETTKALALKVQSEQNPTTQAGTQQLLADTNALVTATPTASDVVLAQQNQSSAVDQMSTIANQANTQLAACTQNNQFGGNAGNGGPKGK